jgi:hypothetical protein
VFDRVVTLLNATIARTGTAKRVTWWTASASVAGWDIVVGGWNIPLVRPTGLGSSGEAELGATLGIAARSMGLDL